MPTTNIKSTRYTSIYTYKGFGFWKYLLILKNHIYICIYGMPCDDQYMHTFYNAKIKIIQHLLHIVIKLKEKGKSQTERIPRRRTSSHVNGCRELQWPTGSGLTVSLCTEDAISDDHKTGFGARMRVQNPSRVGSEIMSGRQMNK